MVLEADGEQNCWDIESNESITTFAVIFRKSLNFLSKFTALYFQNSSSGDNGREIVQYGRQMEVPPLVSMFDA